jgi:CubicO group peptidase (beta-lactamase class C family)
LPDGEYPTLYALLTHTAGYGHLTPAEITVPSLLKHGYARKNLYENCTSDTVIRCLSRRKDGKIHGYSYSDFPYALLAIAAENITGKCFSELFEDFIKNELGMSATFITPPKHMHLPPSMKGHRAIAPWIWKRENPYIAGGGLYCSIDDILKYISIQIESDKPYITSAHKLCESSVSPNRNIATCIGWHTYKKSNQLWHVGGVGTFRSSVIFNRKRKIGVAVLGNSKGIASANVHYLAKMLYSEMKIRKIDFKKFTKGAEYDTPRNK